MLRPGGAVLVYQVFATDRLEPMESAELWQALAVAPSSVDRAAFELAVATAGLRVDRRDELASEWGEHAEEQGDGRPSRKLLRAARLLRAPERYELAIGKEAYAVELGDCLWAIYQMIGKLSPAVYVLRPAP